MLVFGGGSVAHCNAELAVLDLATMQWSTPEAEGPVPPPRAGGCVCVGWAGEGYSIAGAALLAADWCVWALIILKTS
jgi:hypothetical protein